MRLFIADDTEEFLSNASARILLSRPGTDHSAWVGGRTAQDGAQ